MDELNEGQWYDVFLQRAQNGKQFLETKETEDWGLNNVDLGKLSQQSLFSCVLAQFCRTSYTQATTQLNLNRQQCQDLGFTAGNETISEIMDETGWGTYKANEWAYGQLNLAWVEVLGGQE